MPTSFRPASAETFCGDEPHVCTNNAILFEGGSCGIDRNCTDAKCCLDFGGAMGSPLFGASMFVAVFGAVAAATAAALGDLLLF